MRASLHRLAAGGVVVVLTACTPGVTESALPTPAPVSAQAQAIRDTVREAMAESHLNAALVRVSVDGREILTEAMGESVTGVPADATMHFRNGAVAISYVATLLLLLAEDGTVSLEDTLSRWLPDVPHADRVTLRQLAQMTSGYVDYVIGNSAFIDASYADPFRAWTTDELLSYATSRPLLYEPGTNWNYSHTNYILLGLALEEASGQDMAEMLSTRVLEPLGLADTVESTTAIIPPPVLHSFSSERRETLGIPAATPFYEESTYWNPSWTITHGAVQTTTIHDLEATAVGIGSGTLLRRDSYEQMVSTALRGRTRTQPGCPTCMAMTEGYTYGLGVVISGNWLLQNPMFGGYAATTAYLPDQKIAIAVATTFAPDAFDAQGNYPNAAEALFREIGAVLAPDDPPPLPPPR